MKRKAVYHAIAALSVTLLVVLAGCGGGGGGGDGTPSLPGVAVLSNEAATQYADDVVEKLQATGRFSRVDTIGAVSSTPSLSALRAYDGVLIYTGDNGPLALADTTALGDVLADYVDDGGGLVVAFAAVVDNPGLSGLAIGGRYVSEQYYLIPRVSSTFGSQSSGAVLDSTHPILAGFSSLYGGSNHAWAATKDVMPGATVILEWGDGTPLVVTGEINGVRRVDLNFYPPSSDTPDGGLWDPSTDGGLLMGNALTWVIGPP